MICLFEFTSILIHIEYIWVHGSQLEDQFGIFGIQGEYSDTACPGGRYGSVGWSYKSSVYLFGSRTIVSGLFHVKQWKSKIAK